MYYVLCILLALIVIAGAACLVKIQQKRKEKVEELFHSLKDTHDELLIDIETLTGVRQETNIEFSIDFSINVELLENAIEDACQQLQSLRNQINESPKEKDLERRKSKRHVKPKKTYRNV